MSENVELGGYDVEFVDNEPKDVLCSICLLVLREPMQAEQCGHRFCKSCIEKLINRENNTVDCPEDRNTVKVFKDYGREREILNMLVKCSNYKYGCTFTMELRELENHLEVCEFQTISCPIEDCEDQIQRKFMDSHMKVKHYENKFNLLEKKLEQMLQEMQAKSLKVDDLTLKIAEQGRKIQLQAYEISSLKQSLKNLKKESFNEFFYHTYVWNIHDLMEKFESAEEESDYQPQVRSFYTSQGYKIKVEVYLNGDEEEWNENITMYIGLEPGRFDENLKWPMVARIKACIYDSPKYESGEFEFGTRDKELRHKFEKPTNHFNSYGFCLMPVNELDICFVEDLLTLKIEVSHY